jgi:hypothetical protein
LKNKGYQYKDEDYTYCDCECECEENKQDRNKLDGQCDCDCMSIEDSTKRRTRVYGVPLTIPRKAGVKNIPIRTPIKVRIPRDHICYSLPNGKLKAKLCAPEMENEPTVTNGSIHICVMILPDAKVDRLFGDSIPNRISKEIQAANSIWNKRINGIDYGIEFHLTSCYFFNKGLQGVGENCQDFPWSQSNIDKLLYEYGKKACPNAHVYVYYMKGNHIGPVHPNGSKTDAVTFRDYPVIIMSDGPRSRDYILAHELGHFMFLNNLYGYTFDPDPFPGDPDHNVNPDNIMYPTSDFWRKQPSITSAQILKALNTRFFY